MTVTTVPRGTDEELAEARERITKARARVVQLEERRPALLADAALEMDGAAEALRRHDEMLADARRAVDELERAAADRVVVVDELERRRIAAAVSEIRSEQEALARRYEGTVTRIREVAPSLIAAIEELWALRIEDLALYARWQAAAGVPEGPCSECGVPRARCVHHQRERRRLHPRSQEWFFADGERTLKQLARWIQGLDLLEPAAEGQHE